MAEPESRTLTIVCREHGQLWSVPTWCRHDVEEETRRVANAHSAPYGASCRSVLDVELLDSDGKLPDDTSHSIYPGVPG